MEEDIKILEELINAKITFTISPSDYGWKAIEHLIKGYKQLVDISIETAFDDTNKDTELLCRVLLKQGQITIENGMYHRENFDWEKHLKMLGLEKVREKDFFLQDSKIDEYTKQLEHKIKELEKSSIPVSSVEETIEELDEELEIMKVDAMYGRYKEYGSKLSFEKQFSYKYGMHDVLQELLERGNINV